MSMLRLRFERQPFSEKHVLRRWTRTEISRKLRKAKRTMALVSWSWVENSRISIPRHKNPESRCFFLFELLAVRPRGRSLICEMESDQIERAGEKVPVEIVFRNLFRRVEFRFRFTSNAFDALRFVSNRWQTRQHYPWPPAIFKIKNSLVRKYQDAFSRVTIWNFTSLRILADS